MAAHWRPGQGPGPSAIPLQGHRSERVLVLQTAIPMHQKFERGQQPVAL